MADGTRLNDGTGGDLIATDDITGGGVANNQKVQRIKVGFGTDNNYVDVDATTNRLPVDIQSIPAGTNNIGDIDVLTLPSATVAGTTSKTADLDTGVGTDNVMLVGLALPASGGAVVGGSSANPIRVDPVGTTPQPVSGTVTVNPHDVGSITVGVVPGVGSTNLGKAEDAAHSSGDTGVMLLAVRRDVATAGVNADGDYAALSITSTGSLRVDASGSNIPITDAGGSLTVDAPVGTPVNVQIGDGIRTASVRDTGASDSLNVAIVDAAGNQIVNFGGSGGGTQYQEDNPHASGDTGTVALVVRRDTPISSSNLDGDYSVLSVNSVGRLYTSATIDSALPAGSNAIGSVSINAALPTGTNTVGSIASVTTSITPGTAAANLGKAEDAVHTSGDTGVLSLAVRRDSVASGTSADGDYATLNVNSSGRLYTTATIDTALPAGSNTIGNVGISSAIPAGTNNIGDVDVLTVVTGTGPTNLGKAVDAVAGATDTGVAALAVRDDALAALAVADGDYTHLRVTSTGALWVEVTNGINGVNEDTPQVDGGEALPVLAVRRDVAASGVTADGDYAYLSVDASGALRVTGGGSGAQYVEDTPSTGAESLTLVGAVRQDTLATSTSADGDYANLKVAANGRLYTSSTIDAALPTGGNTIGSISSIATSVTPGTAAANLGKAVDSALGATDTGVAALAVRDDALSALTPADNDYTNLRVNSTGALWVAVSNGVPARAEDSAQVDGGDGVAMLAVRRDSATSGVSADGDYAYLSVDANGALRVAGGGGGTQFAEDAAHTSGDLGTLALVVRQDTLASSTSADGDYAALKVSSVGRLYTTAVLDTALPAGTNNIGDVDVLTLPVLPAGDNNIGNVDIVTLPALPAGTNNIGDVDVLTLPALPAGTNNIGDVDVLTLPAIPAGTNTIGNVGIAPRTSGGLSISRSINIQSASSLNVKASAGQLYGYYLFNAAASVRYVKIYNATSAVAGTGNPVITIPLPAGAGANVEWSTGIAFSTGIAVVASTGIADTDTGAPTANDVIGNFFYA